MDLPRSAALARLVVLERTASTNDELAAIASESDEFTVVLTTEQTAGRGRLGRQWIAPPGEALAASVLLRPDRERVGASGHGWLPLLAGLAMARSIGALVDRDVSLKWPNDVLVDGRKACGVLAELEPDGSVVLGSGVNLTIPADRLPTPVSTSLALCGARERGDELVDRVLAGYLRELRGLYGALLAARGDARASGLAAAVADRCSTLGREVRVELPGGRRARGLALGIDADGRLEVRVHADGRVLAVSAGDVTHLRYE